MACGCSTCASTTHPINAAALIALVAGMNDAERLALWTALTGGGCTNCGDTPCADAPAPPTT